MTGLERYTGQVLDEKYRLERLLGQGGMGAVYLATHLGTERYVALKLITPQFMRNEEFVERFKREARAAGRLRHPNVVDVTDFGFARVGTERVAYLVMEYLDGCTLGDVLAEEQRLPLDWVVDILEQVCSAVHEAHQQGIVHRDLKPDNIWLEPNRLGSYRIKVLDFGIAKLAETDASESVAPLPVTANEQLPTLINTHAAAAPAANLEADTLLQPAMPSGQPVGQSSHGDAPVHAHTAAHDAGAQMLDDAGDTRLFAAPQTENARAAQTAPHELDDDGATRMFVQGTMRRPVGQATIAPAATNAGAGLTRVGAIMGTPLYMSPEQCRGEQLDARADIYSLGVIAYQMLAGATPFTGDIVTVMRDHMETPPPPLHAQQKKLPKRVARVVMAALAKDPAERPQTAAAFANTLRAQADGIGALYRRAFALYSEYLPKFLRMSLIAHVPVIVTTFLLIALGLLENHLPPGRVYKILFIIPLVLVGLLQIAAYFLAASAISGMTALIVTQLYVAPLRPVELRTVFAVMRRRWRPFLNTSIRITLRMILGFVLGFIPFVVVYLRYLLYAPVVLMEGLEKRAAMTRARELAARSWRTLITVAVLQFVIPLTVSALLGRFALHRTPAHGGISVNVPSGISDQMWQQLMGLTNIVIVPLMSIVPALLYLRMRQLGGESLSETMLQFEEAETVHRDWQQRMRTRLTMHTPQSRP